MPRAIRVRGASVLLYDARVQVVHQQRLVLHARV